MSDSSTPWTVAHQVPLSMGFSRLEYWSGFHLLLQGIFLIQELNPSLLHCRQILYRLSYKGSPEVSGGGQEELPHARGQGGGGEEQPHSKEWWLRGRRRAERSYSCSRSGGVALRRYPSSKVRSSGCTLLEQP